MISKVSGSLLWSFCEDLVKKGAGYVWGGHGKVYNKTHMEALYKSYNTSKYNYEYYHTTQWKRWGNKIVVDCSGMIQAFRIANLDGADDTANGLYTKCTKKGSIASLPKNRRGVLVFVYNKSTKTMTHVGVYGGDDTTIESKDSASGVKHLRLDKRWTHWGIPDWLNPTIIKSTDIIGAGRVTAELLNVRAGCGSGHKSLRTITKNTVVPLYEISGKWVRISKTNEEWVSQSYIRNETPCVIKASSLNVRNKPNASGKSVDILHEGDKVYSFDVNPKTGWIKISPDEDRWISGNSQYVKK